MPVPRGFPELVLLGPRAGSPRARGVVRRPGLSADAYPVPLEADDIAELELASTTTIDLAADRHEAVNDRLLHVSAGVKEPSELHELAKANALAADGNIVDWRWLCHL